MAKRDPSYPFWTATTLAIGSALLTGRARRFKMDAVALVQDLQPPLQVIGSFPNPRPPGMLIVVNHYNRPGFDAWWIALAIASLCPKEIHWIVTQAWVYPEHWKSILITPLSRWLLARLASIYNFTAMPPMPPRPMDAQARAQSVRRVLRYVHRSECPVVGLAPEGADSLDGHLRPPPKGLGRFVQLLAREKLEMLPVGLYEDQGQLTLNIGELQEIPIHRGDPTARERSCADHVMRSLAACLPASLRGPYQENTHVASIEP